MYLAPIKGFLLISLALSFLSGTVAFYISQNFKGKDFVAEKYHWWEVNGVI